MAKKFWITISLILSILMLIYMILVYYGILRYFKLHATPTEYYIDKYKSLPKVSKDRVVISFTATEKELQNLKPFINSILDQTVRVDDIAITLPYKDVDKVPEYLHKIVNVYGISKDYGESNSIVPVILREPEAKTRIIVVEPSMVYGEDFVADMVDSSENDLVLYGKSKTSKYGILLKPGYFDEKISDCKQGEKCCDLIHNCTNMKQKIIGCPKTFKSML